VQEKEIEVILRKELKDWWKGQTIQAILLQTLVTVGVFGILIPMESPEESNRLLPVIIALMPVFLINNFIADSFAGERERGTLETLLATPLRDRSILIGKIMAGTMYGWAYALLTLAVAMFMLTLEGAALPSLFATLAVLAGSWLAGFLIGATGAIVSIHARTVRSAQQTLSIPLMALFMGIGFGIPALVKTLPETWLLRIMHILRHVTGLEAAALAILLLLLLDGIALLVAIRNFRRTRLLL